MILLYGSERSPRGAADLISSLSWHLMSDPPMDLRRWFCPMECHSSLTNHTRNEFCTSLEINRKLRELHVNSYEHLIT